jgi:hypothetical protein
MAHVSAGRTGIVVFVDMGSCTTEDKACGNQPTNTRMIYRRPISVVVPDPQSLTEKTKETEECCKTTDTY